MCLDYYREEDKERCPLVIFHIANLACRHWQIAKVPGNSCYR